MNSYALRRRPAASPDKSNEEAPVAQVRLTASRDRGTGVDRGSLSNEKLAVQKVRWGDFT
ncbi:MAG: hypothetical protein ABSD43_11785 [Terracidiphilus sp.]|jgi:hypothetical protein